LESVEAWTTPRFLLARMIDVFFSLDLLLQFTIAYRKVDPSEDGHAVGSWVENHKQIAKAYLSGWFWFDLGTLFPSVFDILPTVGADIGSLGGATIFRTFRILRFVKILRVARAGRVFQRWAARISLQHSTQKVIWCIVRLLLSSHWFACIFALQATLHEDAQSTWLGEDYYHYCHLEVEDVKRRMYGPPASPPPVPPAAPGTFIKEEPPAFVCDGLGASEWYLAAFTWAVMIITGVGGTDFYPSSYSSAETAIVLVLIVGGALLWTQILADFCDVASNGDPSGVRFHQTLDELNQFININQIPKPMAGRMRNFMQAQRYCQMRLETAKSLYALSPTLQVEVITYVHKPLFNKVWYLSHIDKSTAVLIAQRMHSSVMAPGEVPLLRRMYIIERGLVLYTARVLTSGKMWAVDDIILTDALLHYERTDRARAMTYVEYRSLSRADLMDVVMPIPEAKAVLRKLAIYVALRRMLIAAMHATRKRDQSKMSSQEHFLDRINSATLSYADQHQAELVAAERLAIAEGRTSPGSPRESSTQKALQGQAEPLAAGPEGGKRVVEMEAKLESLSTSVDAIRVGQAELTQVVQGVATAVAHLQRELCSDGGGSTREVHSDAHSDGGGPTREVRSATRGRRSRDRQPSQSSRWL